MSDAEPATTTAKQRELLGGLPSGTRIRAYEIISILGQGSFGITYLARDTTLNREVAIKEYLPTLLALRDGVTMVMPRSTEQAEDFVLGRERFLAEARTLATLGRAPAVVGIYDFLEANGTAYIVMELARGETLAQHIKLNGQLSPRAIELLVYPLLDGLEQVHGVGYLHRDIKPSNIILDAAGSPTLIDFGAAREAIAGRTTSVTAIFTPGYAAAEQFASAKLGPWTDIYSLSATLYQAITGIQSPSAFERTLDDAYKPLVRLAPAGFSYGLLNGIDAGMQVRAADRPQSIAGWRKLIEQSEAPDDDTVKVRKRRAVASVPAPAADVAAPPAAIRTAFFYKRRRKLIWSSVAATAILLAGGGYFSKSLFSSTAVQALTTEELAQALEERRKADAAAAEKKKLEEEAQRQAAIDAEAKRKADEALVLAQQQRQKAEEELARLKTEMEARRKSEEADRQQAAAAAQKALDEASKQKRAEAEMAALRRADEKARTEAAADALAKQQADEAAQRKAEAETTARRLVEEEARKKAVAEAEAKRQADEALAKAQADRQRADELAAKQTAELEARQKADAEAKAKAEADVQAKAEAASKAKAEADAKAKTEAEVAAKAKAGAEAIAKAEADAMAVKKAAETVETALKLSVIDRQHLQVALTALGFDTKGSDGVFGPRTRDMIAAWQKVRNQPPTGFLNAAHQQALTKEAAPAIDKYDAEQKKIEEEKKKAEEEAKKKAEDEAKKKNDEEAKIKADEEAKARASDDARKKAQESARSLTLQWNVRLEADSFAPSGCVGGTAGILRIKDGVLTWTQDAKPNTPRWTVTLGPDGSADQIVPIPSEGFGVHVTIPAGSGPRIVHSTALGGRRCSFRYLPN